MSVSEHIKWAMDTMVYAFFKTVPRRTFSRLLGWGSAVESGRNVHRFAIDVFSRVYGVDASEAEFDLSEYRTLNHFFTRRLREGARTVASDSHAVVSPTDSTVVQIGMAEGSRLIQAKGLTYEIEELVGSPLAAEWFADGTFVTLYLRPRDYHRVHCPVDGTVEEVLWMPGERYPVIPIMVNRRDRLYARNERLSVILDSPLGKVAVVMVASIGVGNMSLSWGEGFRTGAQRHVGPLRLVGMEGYSLKKGTEFGVFHLGSTVVLLFQEGRVGLHRLVEGQRVTVGQALAEAL